MSMVRKIALGDCLAMSQLFRRALSEDFAYFPGEYVQDVARQHRLMNFARALARPKRLMLGVFDNNKLVGYIIGDYSQPELADIFWLYVAPENRGEGWGRTLLVAGLDHIKAAGAPQVRLLTHQQKEFYQLHDFMVVAERHDIQPDMVMYEMVKEF